MEHGRSDEFGKSILPSELVYRRWIVKLGYVRRWRLCTSHSTLRPHSHSDLSNWDTSRVTNLVGTFCGCEVIHGRWFVKLEYVEGDKIFTFDLPRSRGDSQIGIRRV